MKSIAFETIEHPVYKYALSRTYQIGLENFAPRFDEASIGSTRGGPWVRLDRGHVLTIARGYAWDGASGPAMDTTTILRASLVHDALYQLIAGGALPRDPWKLHADREFYRICREDGMGAIRARWCYAAVRAFGNARDKYRPVLDFAGLGGRL